MFTFNEYADMHLIYGACNSNAAEAVRQYRLRFPDRNQPSRNTFRRLDQRVRETGRLVRNAALTGRPRSTRTPWVEVAVVEAVEHDPTRSVRDIAREVGIPSTIVHRSSITTQRFRHLKNVTINRGLITAHGYWGS